MRVFLTGATGFIGSHLAEALLKQGHSVRALLRASSNLRWIADLKLDCFYADIFDSQKLLNGLKDVDVVIHSAGVTKALDDSQYFRVNFEATKILIDTIVNHRLPIKRFVLISSQAAAGPANSLKPLTEDDEPHPVSIYGKSKLMAEQYVLSKKKELPVTVLRPSAVYGPRDTDVFQFFKTVKSGIIPKWQNRDKYLSFIYVHDLVQAILLASENRKARGQVYFVASPRPHTWDDLARVTLKFFNKKALTVPIPLRAVKTIAAIADKWSKVTRRPSIINRQKVDELVPDFWLCSSQKIKKHLGFEAPTDLETGVTQTLQWYVEQKWL